MPESLNAGQAERQALSESAVVEQFSDAMRAEGIDVNPADIIADGKMRRIHVLGDAKVGRNGWYVLHLDDHPAGMFGCNKRYGNETKFSWKLKQKAQPMTTAERRELRERMRERARERDEADRARHAAAAEFAKSIWNQATEVTGADHPYLARKGIQSHGLRVGRWEKRNPETGEISVIADNALLVPIRGLGKGKTIHSLQAILPDASKLGRDKDYLTDGDKRGRFYSFGKPQTVAGSVVILICEGYATGASLHEATGHAVVVAFDASNLLPVAQVTRDQFPAATIILCADNDQWTLTPINNPGVTRATEAARAVNGRVAFPPFTDEDGREEDGKRKGPTDFNDLAELRGKDAVLAVIDKALVEVEERTSPDSGWAATSAQKVIKQAQSAANVALEGPADDEVTGPAHNDHFKVLGHDHGKYFIFVHETGQVSSINGGGLNENALLGLAPLNWWEEHFSNGKGKGFDRSAAVNFIIRTAAAHGVYDEKSRLRGRGAWVDGERFVYHHGEHLSVNGVRTSVTDIKSRYVYEQAAPLPVPHDNQLSDEEGAALLNLICQFRWNMPASALLFCGWVALAPVCGALNWRPHIWLAGSAGSGKTTLANIANKLTLGTALYAMGNSSEAGIRQRLKADARPVLMDESESNEEGDVKRIQSILSLIRQASSETGAETLKGTADGVGTSFNIRSMFCLASIQVALKNKADIDRLSVLSLRSARNSSDDSGSAWKEFRNQIYSLVDHDPDISRRLLRRMIDLLPVTLQNVDVFTEVAARRFGSQREGDQYGTLLAGAWSLVSQKVVTQEEADELIDSFDWSEHREGAEDDDSQRALTMLLSARISLDHGGTATLYELVELAAGETAADPLSIGKGAAVRKLGQFGLKVGEERDKEYLYVTNANAERDKLMAGTPFAVGLKNLLLRLDGAGPGERMTGKKTTRFPGLQPQGFFVVPLAIVIVEKRTEL